MVRRLEKNGLVEKTQSNEDKRIFHLDLTEKGLKIIEGDYQLYEKFSKLFKNTFSTEQLDMLIDTLDKVVCKLSEENSCKDRGVSK
ncbi:MAG: transcriptional regulator, MarR/EmrR family [Eubacterium sp.]|nr:transcriptional regulator, MarR/EmrR family [Eubacterium sp.]